MGSSAVTPIQALASRAYNQRNMYISGFILYFSICIPTVMSIVKRLVKYQGLINEQEKQKLTKTSPKSEKISNKKAESTKLQEQLKKKQISLEGLQKQVKNLEKYFDEKNHQATWPPLKPLRREIKSRCDIYIYTHVHP